MNSPFSLVRRRLLRFFPFAAASIALPRLWASDLGTGPRAYGERSTYEQVQRLLPPTSTPATAVSATPLQDCYGIITPSALHFESHHAGVPSIDPGQHQLLIHGEVRQPLVFKLDELVRLPAVSRIHFLECAGNTGWELRGSFGATPQKTA